MAKEHVPFVNSVFHLTDFCDASERAFAHALAIALHRRACLTILHVKDRNLTSIEWAQFPAVRKTLERWNVLPEGSSREAVHEEVGVQVKKVDLLYHKVAKATLGYLENHPHDLFVLATHGHKGISHWVKPSIAEQLATKTKTKTLFVSENARPFISLETGEITLRKIVVPVDRDPDAAAVLEYASRAVETVEGNLEIDVLYVGDDDYLKEIDLPSKERVVWQKVQRSGKIVETIVRYAEEVSADMIAMATRGQDGILDIIRGSVTEQVLHEAPCPILAVPALS